MEEYQEDTQRGSDQSQKKHKTDQNKETMNKESSQSEEAPKENYIHMRARRGQATNSHSLAERVRTVLTDISIVRIRSLFSAYQWFLEVCCFVFCFKVRREKISERMRLLQELVPGCNKVLDLEVTFSYLTSSDF